MKIIQLDVGGALQNFLPLKKLFLEELAVPLSLPIWLPPSCSLADSVLFRHQRGGSCCSRRYRRLFFSALVRRIAKATAWPRLP